MEAEVKRLRGEIRRRVEAAREEATRKLVALLADPTAKFIGDRHIVNGVRYKEYVIRVDASGKVFGGAAINHASHVPFSGVVERLLQDPSSKKEGSYLKDIAHVVGNWGAIENIIDEYMVSLGDMEK